MQSEGGKMTDTTPDDALKDTQREMESWAPLTLQGSSRNRAYLAALKRRDAAVRIDQHHEDCCRKDDPCQVGIDLRRAYQEASNGK